MCKTKGEIVRWNCVKYEKKNSPLKFARSFISFSSVEMAKKIIIKIENNPISLDLCATQLNDVDNDDNDDARNKNMAINLS